MPRLGHYNLASNTVHRTATQLLDLKRIPNPPPWYDVIGNIRPSETTSRPLLNPGHPQNDRVRRHATRKASRMFAPIKLQYAEDSLRSEFFQDHPWELARPKVLLEDGGNDARKMGWDWSTGIKQLGKPLDGESVVQRQRYLMTPVERGGKGMTRYAAYDQARKEFYQERELEDIERSVAREEALSTGAYFGKGPMEIGLELEDQAFEEWKVWAIREAAAVKQAQGAMYSGTDDEESTTNVQEVAGGEAEEALLSNVSESVPGSKQGQTARGGVAVHP